jgi:hypothetical protein
MRALPSKFQTTRFLRFIRCFALSSLLAGTWSPSFAQPIDDLIFTAGTTIQDASAHHWSYVLIGAPQPALLAGKRFAVFGKPGLPTNSAPFSLRGTVFQQTDPAAINNLLNQAVALNENPAALSDALNTLLHNVPGIASLPLEQKVLTAFQLAGSDSVLAQSILLLAGMHPGLKLATGQAFAEQITTTTTYEVRDINPATGIPGDVIGRVTIIPGAPVVLPAPGFPFQVVSNAPSDHLRIRLRWGTPDALRRLSLLQYGFNIWRIPSADAISAGYNVTPPPPAQLRSNPAFVLANSAPVMAPRDYAALAGPGGPDDLTDRVTYFFADDNGRLRGGQPFADGANYYYFITARDILGRDGVVSPGGLATACRRLPPQAPTNPRVLNTVVPGSTNQSALLVTWRQNTNAADLVTQYWVYRWSNPTLALTNDNPSPSNFVANLAGVVGQVTGTNFNSFLDTNGPAIPGASNYWYTVRAVSQAACTSLFSPQSAPAWGVLRDRTAPVGTAGDVAGSCGSPVVAFQTFNTLTNSGNADSNYWNFRFTCQRRDRGIAWVQFFVTNSSSSLPEILGPLYFPPDGDTVSLDYSLPVGTASLPVDTACVVGTYYGLVSRTDFSDYTNSVPPGQRVESVFLAGDLLLTALAQDDPLLNTLNIGRYCVPGFNVQPHPDGTVSMQFDVASGTPMQISTPNNTNAYLPPISLGVVVPDTNNMYWVYWEPCLVGPIPPFLGCRVDLFSDENCSQHITSTGDGTVAPIHVRFFLTPRTHEYRLYRRVDDGPLTLVAQGSAVFDPTNPSRQIARTDDAMPPSRARLCYFVQLLDENGNGSPMALIGCKDVKPPKPQRPVLGEPVPTGNTANPQVALNWFCPTAGVYRFEVKIERADQPGSGKPTGFSSLKLVKLVSFNPQPRYFGLFAESRFTLAHFDESQLTPPIGPDFGPGPQFTLNATVVPNVPYHISVAAQDDQGNAGDPSQVWTFTWKPPIVQVTVPWPARPLPPSKGFDEDYNPPFAPFGPRVSSVLMYDTTSASPGLDYRYPVGIRIGDLSSIYYSGRRQTIGLNVNNTNLAAYTLPLGSSPASPGADPHALVFKRFSADPARRGDSLLPIVVYRQQLTNSLFPRVSGNLTQVTPLIERLPWSFVPPIFGTRTSFPYVYIADRLIAFDAEFYAGNSDIFGYFMYVRDQQPVIFGAAYQYFVLRLDAKHEVSEIIPAGTITIPLP